MAKTTAALLILILVGLAGGAAKASTPLDWHDAFQAAVNRSETVADQEELIFQANEKYKQAVGSILPNVTGSWTYFQQTQPSSSNSIATPIQKTGVITATQPLFVGLRDWEGLKQTQLLQKSQDQTKKYTLVQLYQQVTANFYQVLAAERNISDLQTEAKLYDKQVVQLQAWVKIGRSRPADVTQVQAAEAQLWATLESSKSTLDTAREAFNYLTGLSRDANLKDPYPEAFEPPLSQIDEYLGAIEKRPEVQAAVYKRDAADQGVAIAKGANLPTVVGTANYYYQRTGGIPEGNWDFQLGVSLPIFAGGTIESGVRVAASQYRENELFVAQGQRLADQEIRTYFERVRDDDHQIKALQSAKDISWVNYQQEVHDYRLGLVTNLDVLQSLTTYVTNVLGLDAEKFQEKIDYLYLLAATGHAKEVSY